MFYTRNQNVACWSSAQAIMLAAQRKGVRQSQMRGLHSIRSTQVAGQRTGPQPAPPPTAYAEAVIELCGRIWWELEHLAQLRDRTAMTDNSQFLLTAATLRLELLLIMDSCESASWASMLMRDERQTLYSMLNEVLAAIALSPNELRRMHIECAQDRLFDEVMDQCRDLCAQPGANDSPELVRAN
jgi:hypothetical protein